MEPTWEIVEAEQRAFGDLFESLDEPEWSRETLCVGWTVRDMLSHVAAALTFDLANTARLIRFRNDIERFNQESIEAWKGRDRESLVTMFGRDVPSLGQRLLGPGNSLRAMVIHQQDVRRPLGRARALPPDVLETVLNSVLTDSGGNLGSVERAEGLKLVATDIAWNRGQGPELRGPAEALLMAISGRKVALDDLQGPGIERLAEP